MSHIAYYRVSTNDQSIASQRAALSEEHQIEHEYVDEGVSGAVLAADRPGFSELLKFIRKSRLTATKPYRSARHNNALLGRQIFPRGITMHERGPPRCWIERRSVERHSAADTPLRTIGAVPYAYGKPASVVFAERGIWAAMALEVLKKPNRSRASRSRKTIPNK